MIGDDPQPVIDAFVSDTAELIHQAASQGMYSLGLKDGTHVVWDRTEPVQLAVAGRVQALLEVVGDRSPLILCTDKGVLDLTIRGDGMPRVRVSRFARLKIKCRGTSQPEIHASGNSSVLILACESSRPFLTASEFSSIVTIVYDQAQPRCADWPSGWEARLSDVYIGQRLVCFEGEQDAISAAKSLYGEWQDCKNRYIACMRVPGAIPKICPNVVDFRWQSGTVHVELPGPGNPRPWYSPDAHHLEPLNESSRNACTHYFLD